MSQQKNVIEDIYPLSPMQHGLLFHTLYAPEQGLYFNQLVCTLRGALDINALQQAWQRVAARHTALRTAFVWKRRDEPLQVVYQRVNVPWTFEDWRDLPASEQERR